MGISYIKHFTHIFSILIIISLDVFCHCSYLTDKKQEIMANDDYETQSIKVQVKILTYPVLFGFGTRVYTYSYGSS